MNITSINGNKLLLVDNNIIENNDLIINELLSKNLDTAILYKHIDTNKFNIYIRKRWFNIYNVWKWLYCVGIKIKR